MNPEALKQLAEDVASLKAFQEEFGPDAPAMLQWFRARQVQQISYPLDEASKAAIGGVVPAGIGTSALTQIYSVGTSVTAPKAYAGTVLLSVDGRIIEVPYLTST